MWTWQTFGYKPPIKVGASTFIQYMNIALVVPIFCPDSRVVPFLKKFKKEDFGLFVVVDDGSGEEYKPIFDEIRALGNFEVISYPENKGKGHALKEAFRYIFGEHPEIHGLVTADGDGQHTYQDILKVRDSLAAHPYDLVMGVRDFDSPNVPARSKGGNRFSVWYFHLLTGKRLQDTQTGLRGIPECLFPLAIDEQGERYEFEMNFVMDAVKETKIISVPIETVYLDGNKTSHFRPVRDTFRIYRTPITYILVALVSWGIDLAAFAILSNFVFPDSLLYKVLICTIAARTVSGLFNFVLNLKVVFPSKGGGGRKAARYFLMFAINMGLSFGLTYGFSYLAHTMAPWLITLIKFGVDAFLAICNYFVNWAWVFAKNKRQDKNSESIEKSGEVK